MYQHFQWYQIKNSGKINISLLIAKITRVSISQLFAEESALESNDIKNFQVYSQSTNLFNGTKFKTHVT